MTGNTLPPPAPAAPSVPDERGTPHAQPSPPPLASPTTPGATRLSPAGWLASTGAAMLLLASIVVVAGRWETITSEVRFSGLVAALLAIYFAAEATRQRLPSTATSLATLAAALTAPTGIAAASTLAQPWPICVLVGGLSALVATEVQSRRWNVAALQAATAVAAGLTATGLAALSGTPVGLVGAFAAVAFLLVGAERRSVALGVAVAASTLLPSVAEVGIGTGTIDVVGGVGAQLTWSAPLAGLIAAAVIALPAHRRRNAPLVATSVVALVSGIVAGAAQAALAPPIWWTLPAIVMVALEVVAQFGGRSIWSQCADAARPVIQLPLALAGFIVPFIALGNSIIADFDHSDVNVLWTLPATFTAGALWVTTAAEVRRGGREPMLIAVFTAAAGASIAAVVTADFNQFGWSIVIAVAVISALTALVGRSVSDTWLHAAAIIAVVDACAALAVAGVAASTATCVLAGAALVLTGLGFTQDRFGPIDTAALCVTPVLVVVSFATHPALASLAVAVAGAQLVLYAVASRQQEATVAASVLLVGAVVSSWWTTGTNSLAIDAIAPYGADGVDLALGATAMTLLGVGVLLRRRLGASSWLAFAPGLGMITAWLFDAQLDAEATWATVVALSIGLVATAVGGWRRLGAPLVMGTGLIVVSACVSIGPRLAGAPTWSWIALGGVVLLAIAALIERSDRPILTSGDDGDQSLLEQFRADFD